MRKDWFRRAEKDAARRGGAGECGIVAHSEHFSGYRAKTGGSPGKTNDKKKQRKGLQRARPRGSAAGAALRASGGGAGGSRAGGSAGDQARGSGNRAGDEGDLRARRAAGKVHVAGLRAPPGTTGDGGGGARRLRGASSRHRGSGNGNGEDAGVSAAGDLQRKAGGDFDGDEIAAGAD